MWWKGLVLPWIIFFPLRIIVEARNSHRPDSGQRDTIEGISATTLPSFFCPLSSHASGGKRLWEEATSKKAEPQIKRSLGPVMWCERQSHKKWSVVVNRECSFVEMSHWSATENKLMWQYGFIFFIVWRLVMTAAADITSIRRNAHPYKKSLEEQHQSSSSSG